MQSPAADAIGETPEHAVFDAAVLGSMFGDAPEVVASVLQTFMAGMGDNLAELARAQARQDLVAVTALAHRIAGASRMSGAMRLGHSARTLEQTAKRGDAVATPHAIAEVEAQWARVLPAVAAHIARS